MCLAVPAKILTINESVGTLDLSGNTIQADLSLVPEAKPGDYAIVHAGLAIQLYDAEEAQKTLELLNEVAKRGESHRET